jgi:hypothetical protein
MSRELVQTAAKLLAKAQSTTSDHEAIALVERSYGLLAQVINAYDLEHDTVAGGPRRRERRRLYELRRRPRSETGPEPGDSEAGAAGRTDAVARYRGAGGDGGYARRRGIDVQL